VALAGAYVSVAVQGSMETSFKAADIYLTQPGLEPLVRLHELAHATIAIIKRNLLFSLLYNSVFGTLALLGHINPLVAAILMPASSVTVVLSSAIGNRAWRRFGQRGALETVEPRSLHAADASAGARV
jgi:cation transport ATPase